MATTWAFTVKYNAVYEGVRECGIEVRWVNNYTVSKTLDLSSTNATSIAGDWIGFSTVSSIQLMPPHTPVGALGYMAQATLSGTTATLALLISNNAGADGPMVQASAGAIADDIKSMLIVRGN